MATIAFDAVTTNSQNIAWLASQTGTKTINVSVTLGATANCLVVQLSTINFFGFPANFTAVTYGGVAMTSLGSITENNGINFEAVWTFYLMSPPTGTNTLAISQTKPSATGAVTFNVGTCASSYGSVNVALPPVYASSNNSATSIAVTSMSLATGDAVVGACSRRSAGFPITAYSDTLLGDVFGNQTWEPTYRICGSTSATMGWTFDTGAPARQFPGKSAVSLYAGDVNVAHLFNFT